MEKVESLIKALGNATLLVVLAAIAWMFTWYRLDLRFAEAILSLMAFAIIVYCIWLSNHGGLVLAKKLSIPGFMILATITFRHLAPGTAKLAETGAQVIDQGSAQSAEALETPREVPCKPPYFIGKEGRPKFYHAPSQWPVACYDRAGFHPTTREPLKEVTQNVATAIEREREEGITTDQKKVATTLIRPETPAPPPASAPTPPPQEVAMDSDNTRHLPAPIKMKDLRKRQAQHQE